MLDRGFAACSDKARLGMRFWFRCLFFPCISLVRFAESRGFCCLRADGLFRTFVEAAVVVGAHILVSYRLLPAMPVGECRVK